MMMYKITTWLWRLFSENEQMMKLFVQYMNVIELEAYNVAFCVVLTK